MTYIFLIWKQAILISGDKDENWERRKGDSRSYCYQVLKKFEDKCKKLMVGVFTISSASLVTTENL